MQNLKAFQIITFTALITGSIGAYSARYELNISIKEINYDTC